MEASVRYIFLLFSFNVSFSQFCVDFLYRSPYFPVHPATLARRQSNSCVRSMHTHPVDIFCRGGGMRVALRMRESRREKTLHHKMLIPFLFESAHRLSCWLTLPDCLYGSI